MNTINYIKENTREFIGNADEIKSAYDTCDNKYRVIMATHGNGIEDNIAEIERAISDKKYPVLCISGEMDRKEYARANCTGVEVLDDMTMEEVRYNIGEYLKGNNIPSFGHEIFKAALIEAMKRKIREERTL